PVDRQEAQRHDLRVRRQPGDADAVVGSCGDDAGDVRAVVVVIQRLGVEVNEVVAVDVVHVPVVVVVDLVAGDFEGVSPDVVNEVGVVVVHTRVDERNDGFIGLGAGGDAPRLDRVDVGAEGDGVVQTPLGGVAGVVGG